MSHSQAANAIDDRVQKVLLFADIHEYTRLVDENDHKTTENWLSFVNQLKRELLPRYDGRFVKSLGDGFLLMFDDAICATQAALEINRQISIINNALQQNQHMLLRIGLEVGDLIINDDDVYGRSAMLGARLMTLANPGEIIVSAKMRDLLTSDLDADVEDLGNCYVKHLDQPIRAFRIGPPGPHLQNHKSSGWHQMLPTIAVVPFKQQIGAAGTVVLGDILADRLIDAFSVSTNLSVISRLSTTAFRNRQGGVKEIGSQLNADYVLSGTYQIASDKMVVRLELSDSRSEVILWTGKFDENPKALIASDSGFIFNVAKTINRFMVTHELKEIASRPWMQLESYKLLFGAVALMHRNSIEDFKKAFDILSLLSDRATRQSIPHAWMGKWYVLRTQQGWSSDPHDDGLRALDCTKRALDVEPNSSLALTVDGFVNTNLLRNLDVAAQKYDMALNINPNNSLAWLAKGTLHAFMDSGEQAVEGTQRALSLSPFDPTRYFYDSLAGTAKLASDRYEDAIFYADRSLRANKMHTSTLRVKAISQWYLGRENQAQQTVKKLLELEPDLSISKYRARSPATPYATGQKWAEALQKAGVPEN